MVKGSRMDGPGSLRVAVPVLFVVIVLVAIGLGWVKPGLLFYVMTSVVGVLVWLDYEYSRRRSRRDDQVEYGIETTRQQCQTFTRTTRRPE